MAITDVIKRTVLSEYRADVSHHIAELDRLIDRQKKLSESATAAARSQTQHFDQLVLDLTRTTKKTDEATLSWDGLNKKGKEQKGLFEELKGGHDSLMGAYAKGAAVIATVVAAYALAKDALKSYSESLRLEARDAGINIDQLTKSFDGLIDRHEILTFASQTQSGQLKLNQQEMNTMAQAAVELRNRGFDLTTSLEKLKDAAVKGKVDGLDDLGLSIKQGSSKAETLKNLMTELNKVIAEGSTQTNNEADAVQRLGVEWDNAAASAKNYAAQALLAAGGAVDTNAARGYIYSHDAEVGNPVLAAVNAAMDKGRAQRRYQQGMDQFNKGIASGRQGVIDSQLIEMPDDDLSSDKAARAAAAKKLADEAKKLAGQVAKDLTDALVASLQDIVDGNDQEASSAGIWANFRQQQQGKQGAVGASPVDLSNIIGDVDKQNQITLRNDKADSFLARLGLDKPDDLEVAKTALGSFRDAYVGAMTDIAASHMSAGDALKKALGAILGAVGQKMFGLATGELFEAGAHAFLGDEPGAVRHLGAAALYTAGGFALMRAGAALGHTGSSSAPSGGGGGGSGGGGTGGASSADGTVRDHRGDGSTGSQSGQGQDMRPIIFVVGEHFSEMSPRQRAQEADAAVKRALGSNGGRDS